MLLQVLTNEEWYEIMWNLMDSEFRYACAYFMAIIVIGRWFAISALYMHVGIESTLEHTQGPSVP